MRQMAPVDRGIRECGGTGNSEVRIDEGTDSNHVRFRSLNPGMAHESTGETDFRNKLHAGGKLTIEIVGEVLGLPHATVASPRLCLTRAYAPGDNPQLLCFTKAPSRNCSINVNSLDIS
jgi:hypothetical protein